MTDYSVQGLGDASLFPSGVALGFCHHRTSVGKGLQRTVSALLIAQTGKLRPRMRQGITPKSPEVGGEAGGPHTSAATPGTCMSRATEGHAVKGMLGTTCYTSMFGT